MRWKIGCLSDDYENHNEGWSVSNGITSYTAKTEQEASWLKDQLNRVSEPSEPIVVSGFTQEAIDAILRCWQLRPSALPPRAETLAG